MDLEVTINLHCINVQYLDPYTFIVIYFVLFTEAEI